MPAKPDTGTGTAPHDFAERVITTHAKKYLILQVLKSSTNIPSILSLLREKEDEEDEQRNQPMSTALKRALSKDERCVSPPPTRRKTTQDSAPASESYQIPPSQQGYLRIFSWNVNGIAPFLQRPISFSKTTPFRSPLRDFLLRHHWPHILCLQEVKINGKDTATQRALQHAANLDSSVAGSNNTCPTSPTPTYTIHYSLPRDKYNATGFGGKVHGVATLIRDDLAQSLGTPSLTSSTRRVDWDLEGRVLITTLALALPLSSTPPSTSTPINTTTSPTHHLHLIHAYWPNGSTLPYRSPLTGQPFGTRHDYKLRFHEHMLSEALTLQKPPMSSSQSQSPSPKSPSHVLLIGDMNIAPQRIDGHPHLRTSPHQHVLNRADFNEKFLRRENAAGFQGWDVWRLLRGGERRYTYHPRGTGWGRSCDRVDLAVAGAGLVGGHDEATTASKKEENLAVEVDAAQDGRGRGRGRETVGRLGKKGAIVAIDIYDNEVDRGHSDHVPLSVSLDVDHL
ncbi:hypothetical protein GJ744_012498 [Endocarpon pusillum]|uniref:Endonuclease/exonuclease/phosphatase domain-containing protein n=1 Tax=Endocarpon pusillum TaxID=364733 RepID=A0A8H7AEY0_9EURO|nr:hypothetical protein GJ744_012498 [Endocarpon pusillum]